MTSLGMMLSITGVTWGVTLPVLRVEEAQDLQKNATQRLPGPGDLHRTREHPYLKGDGKMKVNRKSWSVGTKGEPQKKSN